MEAEGAEGAARQPMQIGAQMLHFGVPRVQRYKLSYIEVFWTYLYSKYKPS